MARTRYSSVTPKMTKCRSVGRILTSASTSNTRLLDQKSYARYQNSLSQVENGGPRFEAPQLSPRLALSHQRLQAACVRSALLCVHDMKRQCVKNLCRDGFGAVKKVEQLAVSRASDRRCLLSFYVNVRRCAFVEARRGAS